MQPCNIPGLVPLADGNGSARPQPGSMMSSDTNASVNSSTSSTSNSLANISLMSTRTILYHSGHPTILGIPTEHVQHGIAQYPLLSSLMCSLALVPLCSVSVP